MHSARHQIIRLARSSPTLYKLDRDLQSYLDVGILDRKQTLASISMVKNEQDIVEPWVRFHIKMLDVMVVIDNGSEDNTSVILEKISAEFSNLVVVHVPSKVYEQAFFLTVAFRRIVASLKPKYVVFLDGDEFLSSGNRSELLRQLEPIPEGGVGLMRWMTYCHHPDHAPNLAEPLESMQWRRANECEVFKIVARPPSTVPWHWYVAAGSHNMWSISRRPISHLPLELPLFHFPLRNVDQLLTKGAIGWVRSGVKGDSKKNFQWRLIHDDICRGRTTLTYKQLCEHSIAYAQPNFD